MKKLIKNPRKGVSIAEMTIALGAIMIIMVASISLLKTSVSLGIKSSAIVEANNTLESIVEIFNFSKSEEDFKKHLKNLHGDFIEQNSTSDNVTIYIIDCGSYKIKITHTDQAILQYFVETQTGIDKSELVYSKIEINADYGDGEGIYKKIYYKNRGN